MFNIVLGVLAASQYIYVAFFAVLERLESKSKILETGGLSNFLF